MTLQIAILDDYTQAADGAAAWNEIADARITVVNTSLMAVEAARIEALQPFDVIVAMRERTPLPDAILRKLPNLKLIVTTGMRNASIDMGAARDLGLNVCGTQMTPYAAFEHSWALLMALAKNIPAEHQVMRSGGWQKHTGVGLNGKTLGLLGLGKIGQKMARAAQVFEMDVVAWSPNLTAERAAEYGVTRVEKDALFELADFLSIHIVLSETTRGLVGAQQLAQMKSTAFLINTSRGPLVEEAALIEALRNRQIAGAALDVYDMEPLATDHPLRQLENVVLTGHTGYVIREMYEHAYGQALENILAWQSGTPTRVLN